MLYLNLYADYVCCKEKKGSMKKKWSLFKEGKDKLLTLALHVEQTFVSSFAT